MNANSPSSFVRAVSFQMPSFQPDSALISQGLCAIALPVCLITASILHRKHQLLKYQRQVAMLEKLWCRSNSDKVQ